MQYFITELNLLIDTWIVTIKEKLGTIKCIQLDQIIHFSTLQK
jgi:hypothetical protein